MYKNLKHKSKQVSPTEIKSAKANNIKSLDTMKKLLVGHGNSIEDKIATVKIRASASTYEFRCHHIVAFIVTSKIELFGGFPNVSTIFQISQHTISYVMVLLWIGPVLDTLRQIL